MVDLPIVAVFWSVQIDDEASPEVILTFSEMAYNFDSLAFSNAF